MKILRIVDCRLPIFETLKTKTKNRNLLTPLKSGKSKVGNRRGFTLIELMIVIVIIGILATLLVPRIMDRPEEARRIKAKVDIKTLESALKLYQLDNGSVPTTEQGLQALIMRPQATPIPRKWREGGYIEGMNVPKDPWGNPYYYYSPPQGAGYASTQSGGYPSTQSSGTNPSTQGGSYSATQGGKDYEIISYGADGEPGGTGKNADISSRDLEKD
jgi:general secretion pathway protein G